MQIGLHSTEQDVIPTSAIIPFFIITFFFLVIWWNRDTMFTRKGAVTDVVPTRHIVVPKPTDLTSEAAQ